MCSLQVIAMNDPNFTDWLSALATVGTVIVGGAAAWWARSAFKAQREALQHEIESRRDAQDATVIIYGAMDGSSRFGRPSVIVCTWNAGPGVATEIRAKAKGVVLGSGGEETYIHCHTQPVLNAGQPYRPDKFDSDLPPERTTVDTGHAIRSVTVELEWKGLNGRQFKAGPVTFEQGDEGKLVKRG